MKVPVARSGWRLPRQPRSTSCGYATGKCATSAGPDTGDTTPGSMPRSTTQSSPRLLSTANRSRRFFACSTCAPAIIQGSTLLFDGLRICTNLPVPKRSRLSLRVIDFNKQGSPVSGMLRRGRKRTGGFSRPESDGRHTTRWYKSLWRDPFETFACRICVSKAILQCKLAPTTVCGRSEHGLPSPNRILDRAAAGN